MLLEICIDSIESAIAAHAGGADRLEVCSALSVGGTTPSAGLVRQSKQQTGLPTMMMIRPHDGPFIYDDHDIAAMIDDIETAKSVGADGVVFGCLQTDRTIEAEQCKRLLSAAEGLETTFHRAFDVVDAPLDSLEQLIELGFDRVLTSGQAVDADTGSPLIAQLVNVAAGRITILAGAGVSEQNAKQILQKTRVTELHASASFLRDPFIQSCNGVSFGWEMNTTSKLTCAEKVCAIKQAMTS